MDEEIDRFKEYVINNETERVINKYLLFGVPKIFNDDENRYFELKEEVSAYFKIEPTQVYVVGSAKLGFSIAPQKRYKVFGDDSDIDVAIIDEKLFDEYWKYIYEIEKKKGSITSKECSQYKLFLEYLFKGWLRPDLFPSKVKSEWFDFFKNLHGKYGYKIAAGIYKNNYFFLEYNKNNIDRIRKELENGI